MLMSVVACLSDGDCRKINWKGVERFSMIKSKSAHNLPFKKESYFIPMETAGRGQGNNGNREIH